MGMGARQEDITEASFGSGTKPILEALPQAARSHAFVSYASTSAPSPRMR